MATEPASGGVTNFDGYTHQELADMVAHVKSDEAQNTTMQLINVSNTLRQAADTLDAKLSTSLEGWTGAAADSFRDWAKAVTTSTHQLSQYAVTMGTHMHDVANAAAAAGTMPKVPLTEIATVESVKHMAAPTEDDAMKGVSAQTYVEMQRQEAIQTMRRIAVGYDGAAGGMDSGVPPEYPPPLNLFNVSSYKSGDLDGPEGGSGGASRAGTTAGAPGAGGAAEGPTSRGSTGVADASQPTYTNASVGGGTAPVSSPPTDVDLAGNGTLHADPTGPTTTAGPAPNTTVPGDPGKYGVPMGLPPMGGTPMQPPPGGKPGPQAFGRPGVSGGRAVSNPREALPSTGPRAVPGNTLRSGPIEGGTPMRGPGLAPGEAPRGTGRGGMPVAGGAAGPVSSPGRAGSTRSSVRTPGGTVGGEPTAGVGGRPFSRGGSGIRVTPPEGARPGEPSPTGRAVPNSSASPPHQEHRRRRRAEYLEEDESTWTAHGQPVPPVVD